MFALQQYDNHQHPLRHQIYHLLDLSRHQQLPNNQLMQLLLTGPKPYFALRQ
jgi:hypothetical protein